MTYDYETFSNAADFLNALETRGVNTAWKNYSGFRSSISKLNTSWRGTKTFEDAVTLAQRGYTDAVSQLAELERAATCKVKQRVKTRACKPCNAYAGGSPNVQRAMIGLPRDMRTMERKPCKTRGVTIAYNSGVSSDTSSKEVLTSGAHLLALVRLLERDGVPVRIVWTSISFDINRRDDPAYGVEVALKDYGTRLNLAKLAYYMAHVSAQRRLAFAWRETAQVTACASAGYVNGYGASPQVMGDDALADLRADFKRRGMRFICVSDLTTINDVINTYNALTNGK